MYLFFLKKMFATWLLVPTQSQSRTRDRSFSHSNQNSHLPVLDCCVLLCWHVFKNYRHSVFFFFHFKTAAFSSWKQMVWEIEFILSFLQRTFQFPLMRVKWTLNSGVEWDIVCSIGCNYILIQFKYAKF